MSHRAFAQDSEGGVLLSAESPQIVTSLGDSAISAVHFVTGEDAGEVHVKVPREEAYCLLFPRRDHLCLDFWEEGRLMPVYGLPRGTVSFVDLEVEPAARFVQPADYLAFHMPYAAFDALAEDAGVPRIDGLRRSNEWGKPDPVVQRIEPFIVEALARPESMHRLMIDHLMLALAAHFSVAYGGMAAPTRPSRGGLAPWQERLAKELIAANLDRDLSLREIASECGLSQGYFARAFKISTGRTPHGFLQERRVEKAEELLLGSGRSLAEIALVCGFADQSHFTRVFTRAKSEAPGAWRRLRLS